LSRVTGVLHPGHHFGDESYQAIDCTGSDNHKQRNKITCAPEKHKNDQIQKTCPSYNEHKTKKTGLVGQEMKQTYSYNPGACWHRVSSDRKICAYFILHDTTLQLMCAKQLRLLHRKNKGKSILIHGILFPLSKL